MRFLTRDYQIAIAQLQVAMTQISPDGDCCVLCGDSGHQAWECHHNPLVVAERGKAAEYQWRCYHCNSVFTDAEEAREHFGFTSAESPKCLVQDISDLAKLLDDLGHANGMVLKGAPSWPVGIDYESLNEEAAKIPSEDVSVFVDGEESEVAILTRRYQVHDLNSFLNAAFDGFLRDAFYQP